MGAELRTTGFWRRAADPPRVASWGQGALYLGPAPEQRTHRNPVPLIVAALDGPLVLFTDEVSPVPLPRGELVLLAPDTPHRIAATDGMVAMLFMDGCGLDLAALRRLVAQTSERQRLQALLGGIATGDHAFVEAPALIDAAIASARTGPVDGRIAAALETLRRDGLRKPTLARLAQESGLSPSRFLHLFKQVTNVSLRRYKLWIAMGVALEAAGRGQTLTEAALGAGFSSSAHFSSSFRDMFGLEPSRFVALGAEVDLGRAGQAATAGA